MCLDAELWNEFENRPFWYPRVDEFGTFRWPTREEIERLLVSVR